MQNYTNIKNFDFTLSINELKSKKDLVIIIPYADNETLVFISNLLKMILRSVNKEEINDPMDYCVKEIVMNASKANSKRVYFKSLNANINDISNYNNVIKNFRNDLFGNFAKYSNMHIEQGFYVKIIFKIEMDNLIINVINNSTIIPEEEKRIFERLNNANKFNSIAEVMDHVFDQTEGGGFGFIISILMLKKLGLDENVIILKKNENETSFTLKIPLNLISKEHGAIIAQEITNEIESMPQFPENILRLQKNLSDPNCDYNSVANIIKTDTSLTTEIIRIANSPIYMLSKKVEDVFNAVRMIGMNGVKNLILSFGVNKIFEERYDKQKINEILEHSYKVAMYAGNLTKIKNLKPLFDDSYVGALLHDLGKIIVNTLHPNLLDKIHAVCMRKGIPVSTLEDLTDGYNHSLIGAILAEKWNFPDKFIQCIKYHHIPLESNENNQTLVMIVYLANQLFYYLNGQINHQNINFKVLKFFGLENENTFKEIANKIKTLS
jgi:putative nucleotidyltransferase with HDIG domain